MRAHVRAGARRDSQIVHEWEAAGDRDQAAMGQRWEGWRDNKLDIWNGYREIWRPNSFFEVEP